MTDLARRSDVPSSWSPARSDTPQPQCAIREMMIAHDDGQTTRAPDTAADTTN